MSSVASLALQYVST